MQGAVVFKEEQGFNPGWLRFLLPALISIAAIITIIQYYTKDESLTEGIVAISILTVLAAILFSVRMKTEIRTNGIAVQFSPFHRSPTVYTWDSIEYVFIREYNPLKEYGGWGIRTGLFGKGSAYNMSGTIGIQLVFTNGKRHLIGTCEPHKAAEALKRLGRLTPPDKLLIND